MYYFVHPTNKETRENTPAVVDWEFANKEICQAKGFSVGGGSGMSKGLLVLLVFQGDMKVVSFTSNGLVVKELDSQSRGPVFKTTGWLQVRLSLSSSRGRSNEYQEFLGT